MIYEGGMSQSESTGRVSTTGTGYTSDGQSAMVNTSGSVTTQTTTQTALSKKCSPPQPANLLATFASAIAFGFIVTLILWMIFSNTRETWTSFFYPILAISVVLGVVGVRRGMAYNRDVLPGLWAEYKKKWMCMKCGESYQAD